jgi:uncharacterized protein HemX
MVPRPRNPFRKSKDDASSEAKTTEAKPKKRSKLSAAKIAGPKPVSSKETPPKAEPKKPDEAAKTAAAAPAPTPAVATKKPPAPNVQERIEGLQGWMAEIERKQGRMTYFGAAALLVALLASAAAIYLGITNQQNSADKDDFESLETRVTEIGDSLKSSTEEQLKTLNSNLAALEQRLDAIDQKQKQTDTAIQDLQKQINQQAAATTDAAAQGTTTPTAPATPDTKP